MTHHLSTPICLRSYWMSPKKLSTIFSLHIWRGWHFFSFLTISCQTSNHSTFDQIFIFSNLQKCFWNLQALTIYWKQNTIWRQQSPIYLFYNGPIQEKWHATFRFGSFLNLIQFFPFICIYVVFKRSWTECIRSSC